MPINIVPKQSEEDNERDAREAAVAGPLKAPKKRIVTKEEMKKRGMTIFVITSISSKVRYGVRILLRQKLNLLRLKLNLLRLTLNLLRPKTEDEKKFGTFGARGRKPKSCKSFKV
jgi:hypothetical protein